MNSQLSIVFLTVALVLVNAQSIDDCLQQDSISCVQRSLYRKAKEFFDKDSLELVSGVSLVKSANGDRSARTSKQIVYDQEIDTASDVSQRQNVLENFIGDEAGDFVSGRSLRINFAPVITKIGESARAMVDSVPEEVKQAVDEVVEGRGKKKSMKGLMKAVLGLAKLKIGILATLGYFVIGLLAKKAIFASLISLAISGFIGLKSLWDKKSHGHDVTGYNAGGWSSGGGAAGWAAAPAATAGWSSGGSAGWDDHSSYPAHSQAFSGYHH